MDSSNYNLRYLLTICGVAALGGLLFGYDTAVISGAIEPIQRHFNLSSLETGWAVSNVAIGCIIGAFASGAVAARLGRKKTLIIAALLFTISAVGTAVATSFFWFVIYRFIGGVAVGIASAVSPMYMSEVSPKNLRGRALSMQNIAIVFGQVVIFVVNYLSARGGHGSLARRPGLARDDRLREPALHPVLPGGVLHPGIPALAGDGRP